jgi:hypothetical protein
MPRMLCKECQFLRPGLRCRGDLDIESDRKRSSRTLEPLYLVETFEHSVHIMGMH